MSFPQRLGAFALAVLSTLLAVGLNHTIEVLFGLDLSSFFLMIALPVGTIVLGVIALSGYLWMSRRPGFEAARLDALVLTLLALSLPFLIYGLHFWRAGHPGMGYLQFIANEVTQARPVMHIHGRAIESLKDAGEGAWLFQVIRLSALLAVAHIVAKSARRTDSSAWRA